MAIERSLDPRPCGILGVPPSADEAMIRKSYRMMAKLLHPDKCSLPEAEAAFKRVKDAFESLLAAEAWKAAVPPSNAASGAQASTSAGAATSGGRSTGGSADWRTSASLAPVGAGSSPPGGQFSET